MITAVLAVVAHYYATTPTTLILAVVAAGLGITVDRTQVARVDHDAAVTDALYTEVPEK